ncbi:MAG: aldehyde dehydrogenase family protein [Humidesulfovibrio sp.]|nr:aldehyde dehydrogenase family protein [Humidesulfovibrio sp.]
MQTIPNRIGAKAIAADDVFVKLDPATGERLCYVSRSGAREVGLAVAEASRAQPDWARLPAARRGDILFSVAETLASRREEMAALVSLETGKSRKDALAEIDGAVALGRFMAGEGRRLYGKTTTSAMDNRMALTMRRPVGVAGLIVAANTPIANVAWKVFPALICGNAAVLKPAEDTPGVADLFMRMALDAGLPPGALNVVQGLGAEAGKALVAHEGVDVVSFTGSTAAGLAVQAETGRRLAKTFLELGGKNALVVCDDANLDNAVKWALLSSFSNAGQRCASSSRIIVMDGVHDAFRGRFLEGMAALKVGTADGDDFGPVISQRQLDAMLAAVEQARAQGGAVLAGGHRLTAAAYAAGFFMAPTLLEGVAMSADISRRELFGPITCLYRARDFDHALELANDSPYGLTASVHTRSLSSALEFRNRVEAGVVVVNAGTHGSEPHMPFGGLKNSGNGLREPGVEALDVYSEWQTVYLHHFPEEA